MKTYRSRWGWMVPVVLALTLTACGPASAPANTVTPAATASPMPTVTTAPTVSPAPTASTVSTASPAPTASSTVAAQSYADPFAYCAAVGAVDKPDARYTGAPITDEVINGYLAAAGLQNSTEPMDMLRKTTIWRCMGGKVYACNFGANLPCDSKANTDKMPTQGMIDFCTANPDSDFIPAAVTGHDTIYAWHCVKTTPEVQSQVAQVDAAGYLANIWYLIARGAAGTGTSTAQP